MGQTLRVVPASAAMQGLTTGAGALTPSLPPPLRLALASGLETLIVDPEQGGGVRVVERPNWHPPSLDADLVDTARDWLLLLTDNLAPIEAERLGAMLAVFLAHRWRGRADEDMAPILREAVMVDWITDLGEFSEWAISAAMQAWRQNEEWHPTIAGIRRLAEAEVADDRRTLRLLNRLLESPEIVRDS